jgi:hypothetical protein
MAAFLSRTVDGALKRGGRRAALGQFWTNQGGTALALTTVGANPSEVAFDGADLWVANQNSNTVSRVRASDGKLLETWTGATEAYGVLAAMGKVFVDGASIPNGRLFRIDPASAAGAVTTIATNLGNTAFDMAFDGSRIWTANLGGGVSIVTPQASLPWTVTTVTTGFGFPIGVEFDGANVWVVNLTPDVLLKVDANGAVLQTVTLGASPQPPVFDGSNLWVPNGGDNTITVVRTSSGSILATLTGNGLDSPANPAFDGQRILVPNNGGGVSVWKAADLTPLGSFPTPASSFPNAAASDGVHFWITLQGLAKVARF